MLDPECMEERRIWCGFYVWMNVSACVHHKNSHQWCLSECVTMDGQWWHQNGCVHHLKETITNIYYHILHFLIQMSQNLIWTLAKHKCLICLFKCQNKNLPVTPKFFFFTPKFCCKADLSIDFCFQFKNVENLKVHCKHYYGK